MPGEEDHWVFLFDPNRCIGCHACTISCKQYHDRGPGADDWRTVTHHEMGTYPNVREVPLSMSCMHCHDAPCEQVCPADAITKRDSDGIVTVDRDACIGCHYCEWACPFGAPTYGDEGLMSKCNMCLGQGPGGGAGKKSKNEQDDPVEPNCVSNCVGEAIKAGPQSEMVQEASKAAGERFLSDSVANGRVIVEPMANGVDDADLATVEDVTTPFSVGD